MANDLQTFTASDLALIRKTVARDCNPQEFDMFIHIAKSVGLDPLRRMIYAFIFGKDREDDDRQLTVVTAIDGYRTISARSGDYRPADKPTLFEIDPALKSPTNPHGIIRAEVTLYKWSHGGWFPVIGEAFWDEFCPTRYRDEDMAWVDTGKTYQKGSKAGRPIMKKVPKEGAVMVVDPSRQGWAKGPRNQISKCAEAQAHRKGWPNDFAGVVVEEEIDRMRTLDLTATEAADYAEQQDRIARIGGPDTYIIDWMDGGELQAVPGGKMHDQAMAFLQTCEGPSTARAWRERNAHSLKQFWAVHKSDALAIKSAFERAEAMPAEEVA